VATDGIQQRLWDPGLAGASKPVVITRFWVNFASHAASLWDPGSARHLLSLSFVRHDADFNPSHHHTLGIAWQYFIVLIQLKCGELYHIAWLVRCVDSAFLGISSWCLSIATMQFSLLVGITQRGDSYVHNGDWIWLQQNITSLVLVYALLQITDALFSACKVQLFQVSWNIIFMLHILVHVAGKDPGTSHLLDVQWNFLVASLIVA
jgi:hypothetical protein